MRFKVTARAARLLGLWAAGQMGMKDAEAEFYARQASEAVVVKSGHEDLIAKIESDLRAKGVKVSRHRLEREMESSYRTAREQIAMPKET